MKVKMLKSIKGSPNGIRITDYVKGDVYDIPESLFNVFVYQLGVAEAIPVDIPALKREPDKERETQAFVAAPQNKSKSKETE